MTKFLFILISFSTAFGSSVDIPETLFYVATERPSGFFHTNMSDNFKVRISRSRNGDAVISLEYWVADLRPTEYPAQTYTLAQGILTPRDLGFESRLNMQSAVKREFLESNSLLAQTAKVVALIENRSRNGEPLAFLTTFIWGETQRVLVMHFFDKNNRQLATAEGIECSLLNCNDFTSD